MLGGYFEAVAVGASVSFGGTSASPRTGNEPEDVFGSMAVDFATGPVNSPGAPPRAVTIDGVAVVVVAVRAGCAIGALGGLP